jgi:hypothetical protein
MKRRVNSTVKEPSNIKELLGDIKSELQKIDRCEGDIVASHIRLASYLRTLRDLAKKDWATQLASINICPRVGSRYLKIAEHWPDGIGLRESDLLPRLPPDLLKLEWLCRVPTEALGTLLTELDCKKATRPQVIAAVRKALGETPPLKDNEGNPGVEKTVEAFLRRVRESVDRLQARFTEPKQQELLRVCLTAGLNELKDALGELPVPGNTESSSSGHRRRRRDRPT